MDIEKNKAMPEHVGRKGGPSKYPFGEMEVGDSIVVDGICASGAGCKAYAAAMAYGRYHGKRFSGERIREPGLKVRIWRVE